MKVLTFFSGLLLSLVLFNHMISCGNGEETNHPTNLESDMSRAIAVETCVIQRGKVADKVNATGTIFPLHDVMVSSETAGTIVKIYVEVGDRVEKGTPLVQIDRELKQLALEQAEAKAMEARAAYQKSVKDFERNEKLFQTRDISEFVFENARLQKESAEAAHLMARANVKIARRQLGDALVVSPVRGFVAKRLVELGGMTAPGTPIAKIVDISRVKIKFGVPEKDIVRLEKAQPAIIHVGAYRDVVFRGSVASVGPQADLSTRSFPVEIIIDNPRYRLKAGMMANVQVTTKAIEHLPLLPKSALLERGGQTMIFVIENGVAMPRFPQLGLEVEDKIAVLKGAVDGEEVVILGQENLTPGVRVEVKKRRP